MVAAACGRLLLDACITPGASGPSSLCLALDPIMAAKNKYTIKRRDRRVDDVVIESEGLTIGRLTGNDLVLNHRAVDHTHAGIKEIEGEYWIFNLSQAHGIVLN